VGRRRAIIFGIISGGFFLWLVIGFWANIYVEALWFDQLNFGDVFWTTISARFTIGLLFGIVAAIVVGLNMYLARHYASRLTELHLFGEELSELDRLFSGSKIVDIVTACAVVALSGILGLISMADWDRMLRFLNQEPFNAVDPIFGFDIGFFVFSLPFWNFIRFWLLLTIVASGIGVTLYYLYRGAVVIEERGMQIRSYVRNHLCILAAVVLVLIAWGYRLSMFQLLYSESGFAFGAGYTDLHARLQAYWLLLFISLVCAGLFIASLYSQRRNLPVIAIGGMVGSMVLISGLYPFMVQELIVKPDEFEKEHPYIDHNINYTLEGYGLDSVNEVPFQISENLTSDALQSNATTIQNIKLQDKRPLRRTYQQLQEIRTYYDFSSVDEDRYVIDGEYRQVMLAAREIAYDQIPSRTWQNEHLVYTHGYGLCLSPVNTATPEGLPHLFVKDIPPVSISDVLQITRPELYFGENMSNYSIVKTNQEEFDYPEGSENKFSTYEGEGGVQIDSYLRRIAFARYFDELNILISPLITSDSQVMFHRQVLDRVKNIAPFLEYDYDPYLVIADGKLFWMIDAYSVTASYPYSQRSGGVYPQLQDEIGAGQPSGIPGMNQSPRRRLTRNQPTLHSINYIRNSAKITIDAYSGETKFYIADEEDPLILTYQKIFPTLFKTISEMPGTLREHIRYPRDLFAIQAAMYRTYHMQNAQVYYNQEDLWAVPQQIYAGTEQAMFPYYAVMKTSQMQNEELLLLLPFTPSNKENMIGWMAAQCDGPNYGRIQVYNFPKQELVYGPMQVEARISQDADIAKELTLWNQEGSEVIRGDIIVVPIQESLLYIEPLYLRQRSSRGGLPELKRVIVSYGNRIAMEERLDQALAAIFSFDRSIVASMGQTDSTTSSARNTIVNDLAQRALSQFNQAQDLLRDGDFAGYGISIQQLESVLRRLAEDTGRLKEN